MESLCNQVEEERQTAATKGEGILLVSNTIIVEAKEGSINFGRNYVAEGILQVSLPEQTTRVVVNIVN